MAERGVGGCFRADTGTRRKRGMVRRALVAVCLAAMAAGSGCSAACDPLPKSPAKGEEGEPPREGARKRRKPVKEMRRAAKASGERRISPAVEQYIMNQYKRSATEMAQAQPMPKYGPMQPGFRALTRPVPGGGPQGTLDPATLQRIRMLRMKHWQEKQGGKAGGWQPQPGGAAGVAHAPEDSPPPAAPGK